MDLYGLAPLTLLCLVHYFFCSSPCSLNPKPKSSVLDSKSTCTKNSRQPLAEHKLSVLDSISLIEIESNKLKVLIC